MPDAPLTGPTLAYALFDRGLAPAGTRFAPDHRGLVWYWHEQSWEPWHRIEHCWHLVEKCGLTLSPMFDYEAAPRWAAWWSDTDGWRRYDAATFADLPTAICQAALAWQAWRNEHGHA